MIVTFLSFFIFFIHLNFTLRLCWVAFFFVVVLLVFFSFRPMEVNFNRMFVLVQLIFSGEYTKAMNKDWHSGHFCCWQCDESLTGQRYVLRDEHPYCIKCYESVFANGCEECNKIIGIDSKVLFSSYNSIFVNFRVLKLDFFIKIWKFQS